MQVRTLHNSTTGPRNSASGPVATLSGGTLVIKHGTNVRRYPVRNQGDAEAMTRAYEAMFGQSVEWGNR